MAATTTVPVSFTYDRWRHGGWYVAEVRYSSGAVGCISNNYADKKWRVACDPRPFDEQPTFPNRDAAARAEYELAADERAIAAEVADMSDLDLALVLAHRADSYRDRWYHEQARKVTAMRAARKLLEAGPWPGDGEWDDLIAGGMYDLHRDGWVTESPVEGREHNREYTLNAVQTGPFGRPLS